MKSISSHRSIQAWLVLLLIAVVCLASTVQAGRRLASLAQEFTVPVVANVVDSPPVDGFVPWIAVAVTDERLEELELDAISQTSVIGNYLTAGSISLILPS